jgi:hypothetical protein
MIKMKALSAAIILSAAVAAPAFAQEAGAIGPGNDYRMESQPVVNYRKAIKQNFRGAYNQSGASFYARPLTNEERRNIEDFGFSGRDPSMPGGEDPYLHPGG